jgi:hypothetical protein
MGSRKALFGQQGYTPVYFPDIGIDLFFHGFFVCFRQGGGSGNLQYLHLTVELGDGFPMGSFLFTQQGIFLLQLVKLPPKGSPLPQQQVQLLLDAFYMFMCLRHGLLFTDLCSRLTFKSFDELLHHLVDFFVRHRLFFVLEGKAQGY